MALAAGARHTCALLEGGAERCWGDELLRELGLAINTFPKATIGDDETPASLGADGLVALGGKAVAISAGYNHVCAARGRETSDAGVRMPEDSSG